jgi:hypothetical protein
MLVFSAASHSARTNFNALTGNWWNPSRSGEGLVISDIEGDIAVMAWFTYDPARPGSPIWLTGAAVIADDTISFDLVSTRGGRFGVDFDPSLVERVPWGRATLTVQSCNRLSMTYTALSGASGTIQLERSLPMSTPLCEPYTQFSGQTFEGLRRARALTPSDGNCPRVTFNPDETSLSVTASANQITLLLDNFFDGQCRLRGAFTRRDNSIAGSGTYLCSEGLREGTWTILNARVGATVADLTVRLESASGTCRQEVQFRGVIPP